MKKILKYWPVILIYVISFLFSILRVIILDHISTFHIIEGFMASFLILFGLVKTPDIKGFAQRFSSYDIIAKKYSRYGLLYPFIEISLGLSMLIKTNFIADYLMIFFSLVGLVSVYISIIKKQRLYCACLGTTFNLPLSYVAVIENLTMLASALAMVLIGHT